MTAAQPLTFHARAGEKVRDRQLQQALQKARPLFVGKRARGVAALAEDSLDFERLRDAGEEIRNRVLADL
ncbi:MAG TPA: (Fe-S)-binding protein, partial [Azonexus sp.]